MRKQSKWFHISQPYSNKDLMLELKIIILLRRDMLDDSQTRLNFEKALCLINATGSMNRWVYQLHCPDSKRTPYQQFACRILGI